MRILTVTFLVTIASLVGSTSVLGDARTIETREIDNYPFQASSNREAIIKLGYRRITIGMTQVQVKAILGEADEIRYLYEPRIKTGKRIGYTHWFVIRRIIKNGSVNERDESLVRVSFNFKYYVTAIDSWGIIEENR